MLPPPPRHPRRIVYLGTPDIAVPPLRALHDAGHDIALVVSRPDRRRGRGSAVTPSPVKQAAVELGLAVTDELTDATDTGADLGVVVAYGRLIPAAVLARLPMVNLHFSLLPRWRGAAPVERALLAGDAVTGVCVMGVDEELDTGDVYRRAELAIGPHDTAVDLRRRLSQVGAQLLVDALADGLHDPRPQEGEPTYAAKIHPSELAIDWRRPAVEIDRLIRVGGAHTSWQGKRLKIWQARPVAGGGGGDGPGPGVLDGLRVGTGDGLLELVEVQPEGKARLAAAAWHNGARPGPGARFGDGA